ncbi:hypothetical protein MSG66_04575 [Acinetobacter sp. IK31]|uniref:hypothetical protein n=1 Tax=Acinetobacter sp. IK31 TaxID=2928895 RepID=UPI002D20E601|nr:hypothetical protein [Acinetobacter sp. IK31]MEB3863306.1 hypothetical protein [Acinetobacter sp. IK31]
MFINEISNNVFLKKLYSDDITSSILIGRFSIDLSGYCDIDFHVNKEPDILVEKYGVWGVDYNTVVIKTKGRISGDVLINGWLLNDYKELTFKKTHNGIFIKSTNGNFNFSVEVNGLIFQGISVYFDGKD